MNQTKAEQEYCTNEAHQIAASDEYFAARPQLDDNRTNRRIYDAGFKAAISRRLSPMEAGNAALKAANKDCVLHFDTLKADYDKLLAVNKVLVDALTYMVHIFKGTDAHYAPAIKAVSDATHALKLAGEIK